MLAALLFHELAHKVVFIKGDTAFNEGFATAVELIGPGESAGSYKEIEIKGGKIETVAYR